jgi:hypothetical protein
MRTSGSSRSGGSSGYVVVRQDEQGRFCVNGLHRAAGGDDRYRPTYWLKNPSTIDLARELSIDGIPSIVSKQGLGTFVVKELVYIYAKWVSPAFEVKVTVPGDARAALLPMPTDQVPA